MMFQLRNNIEIMSKMRTILTNLMESKGHKPYDLHQISGVHPTTTYRYLKGVGELSPATVKKIARAYGITESQLRGDVPIEGMTMPKERLELKDLLTLNEYRHLCDIRSMDEETRDAIYKLTESAVAANQSKRESGFVDRRTHDVYPNDQLRVGDNLHRAPPSKRNLRRSSDGRDYYQQRAAKTHSA